MKKLVAILVLSIISIGYLFGFSACSSATPEEKDYNTAAKIFDADYKEISIEKYNELYNGKFADKNDTNNLQGDYISYIYLCGGDTLGLNLTDLSSVAYTKDNDLLYARIVSAGKNYRHSDINVYNYEADCKLYGKDGNIYQSTTINGKKSGEWGKVKIEEKNYATDVTESFSTRKVSDYAIMSKDFPNIREDAYDAIERIRVCEDEQYIKIEIQSKEKAYEDAKNTTFYITSYLNYVFDKDGKYIAHRWQNLSDTKMKIIFALVPFEKEIVYPDNFDDYKEGHVYYDCWDD